MNTTTSTTTRPTIAVMGHAFTQINRAGGKVRTLSQHDRAAYVALEQPEVVGLLLLGGGDVNPRLYDQEQNPLCYGVDNARDEAEYFALEAARSRGIPIMGICRGSQMMNVHAGGTLHQDIQSFDHTHSYHRGNECRVVAVKGSRLAKAWRKREQWSIHIHHQAVDQVAPGMVASAYAHDGTIEAIESVEGWELGVQFHPEMDTANEAHQRIFNRFVLAAARFAGLPDPQPLPAKKPVQATFSYGMGRETSHPTSRPKYPVSVSWRCGQHGIRFDVRGDYVDHMKYLHEQDVDAPAESTVEVTSEVLTKAESFVAVRSFKA